MIKFLTPVATSSRAYDIGDEASWPELDEQRLVESGAAEFVVSEQHNTAAPSKRRGRPSKNQKG